MTLVSGLVIAILLVVLTLSSYVARLYAEMGKFLSGEFQENIDVWELKIEPRLGLSRERIALSAECSRGGPGSAWRCPRHRSLQSVPPFRVFHPYRRAVGRTPHLRHTRPPLHGYAGHPVPGISVIDSGTRRTAAWRHPGRSKRGSGRSPDRSGRRRGNH